MIQGIYYWYLVYTVNWPTTLYSHTMHRQRSMHIYICCLRVSYATRLIGYINQLFDWTIEKYQMYLAIHYRHQVENTVQMPYVSSARARHSFKFAWRQVMHSAEHLHVIELVIIGKTMYNHRTLTLVCMEKTHVNTYILGCIQTWPIYSVQLMSRRCIMTVSLSHRYSLSDIPKLQRILAWQENIAYAGSIVASNS